MADTDTVMTAPTPVEAVPRSVGVYERPKRLGSPVAIAIGVVAVISLAIALFMLLRRA